MIKKAVIVAAGISSRLYPLTKNKPKCLLRIGKETLLDRSLRILRKYGIKEIVIVGGYKYDLLRKQCNKDLIFRLNPFFKVTNNMVSLWFARNDVEGRDFLYLHSDLLYNEEIIARLTNYFYRQKPQACLAVDFKKTDEEAMKVTCRKDGILIESSKIIDPVRAKGEWTGIGVISKMSGAKLFDMIEVLLKKEKFTAYDTLAFSQIAGCLPIHCLSIGGLPWIEIDTREDFILAKKMMRKQ